MSFIQARMRGELVFIRPDSIESIQFVNNGEKVIVTISGISYFVEMNIVNTPIIQDIIHGVNEQ